LRTTTVDQDAGEQAPDAPEAVEHHVLGLREVLLLAAHDRGQLLAQERVEVLVGGLGEPVQLAEVDGAGAEVQRRQRLEEPGGVLQRELGAVDPAGEAVRLDDLGDGLVDQGPAVDGGDHLVLAVQPAHQGNHGLGERLALGPALGSAQG
jgi:ribosomal protein S18 acetylase RimI-like enzyme